MAKDPVCGMEVEEQKAAGTSQYQGRSYFSCSKSFKEQFNRNPEQYANRHRSIQVNHSRRMQS